MVFRFSSAAHRLVLVSKFRWKVNHPIFSRVLCSSIKSCAAREQQPVKSRRIRCDVEVMTVDMRHNVLHCSLVTAVVKSVPQVILVTLVTVVPQVIWVCQHTLALGDPQKTTLPSLATW
jgi:hypothetical protein